SRIDALCAYDWIYDTMTDAERKEIGKALFDHMKAAQNLVWISKSGAHNKGEGVSPWSSSFYGTPLLKFYTGLTFLKAGIDDPAAEKYLKEGLSDHLKMLTFRASMAGADGGGNNSTPGYAFGDGPVCEWYFYHTWRNLTGHNIAMDFPGNGMLPHWLFYATFPGPDGSTLEHGSGGAWHMDNKLKMNLRHLAQYRKFYDRHPAAWLVDYFIAQQDEFKDDGYIYKSGSWSFTGYPPWLPFMYKYTRRADYKPDPSRFENFPNAYFFRNLGQTYMFSGRSPEDTYVMFTCGSKTKAHKQYDENHFVIYKGGFLAMDTGTRTASGYKDWLDDCWHDNNYAAHSIAHNVVLIRMEGEKWGGWPAPKYSVANHAGMCETTGGIVKAFETNDLFTYICGDSTACYRKEKCRKMIRQFVFIRPDYFVICDTVESVKPEQTQTWLLHSQNEPVEEKDQFHFDENAGRLFCRTFLPKDFRRTKVGGPGKEFWVDGKNYPLGKTRLEEYKKRKVKKTLWGNWRVELTAGKPTAQVRFLNLIQVGMKAKLQKMAPSEYVTEEDLEGVRFTAVDGTDWTVLFDRTGLKGKIRAEKDGMTLLDSALTEKIQKQKAFQK
ncbi:MAG: heparinase II/III family protein, partial [Lentisphaeria bacterium]|nr:heparinase II/III family protein [Lentisphaeria bacterium]